VILNSNSNLKRPESKLILNRSQKSERERETKLKPIIVKTSTISPLFSLSPGTHNGRFKPLNSEANDCAKVVSLKRVYSTSPQTSKSWKKVFFFCFEKV
jgi:hypothetical protein